MEMRWAKKRNDLLIELFGAEFNKIPSIQKKRMQDTK